MSPPPLPAKQTNASLKDESVNILDKQEQFKRLKKLAPSVDWSEVPDKVLIKFLPQLDKLIKPDEETIKGLLIDVLGQVLNIKDIHFKLVTLWMQERMEGNSRQWARRVSPHFQLDKLERLVEPNDQKMHYKHQHGAFSSGK